MNNASAPNMSGDIRDMMFGFRCTVGQRNRNQAALYLKLMVEELCETIEAQAEDTSPVRNDIEQARILLERSISSLAVVDDVKLFDGGLDVMVVTLGFLHSMGYPVEEGWRIVHTANMAKIDPATGFVRQREDGKVLKPEGWLPPDPALEELLRLAA